MTTSFHPSVPSTRKLHHFQDDVGDRCDYRIASGDDYCKEFQMIHLPCKFISLQLRWVCCLLTFASLAKGHVLDNFVLIKRRRAFRVTIKKLTQVDASAQQGDAWSNNVLCLPYMFLQLNGEKPDKERCGRFFRLLTEGDTQPIRVIDFNKKSKK